MALVVLSSCTARASADSSTTLTSLQRAQVIQIVRVALKKDPSILRDAILSLQSENARIQEAAMRATIARVHHAVFGVPDATLGNSHGRVVIAEFFDTRCPYCRQLAPKLNNFLAHHRDVELVYKDLPILGPGSELGARALLAAQRQNAYEAMRDELMRGTDDITASSIRRVAARLGLDWPRLQRDMNDPAIARRLEKNTRVAKTLGVDGTPAVIIGDRLIAGPDMSQIADAVAAMRRTGAHGDSLKSDKANKFEK